MGTKDFTVEEKILRAIAERARNGVTLNEYEISMDDLNQLKKEQQHRFDSTIMTPYGKISLKVKNEDRYA